MSSDPRSGGTGDGLGANSTWPALTGPEDIEEFPLLLTSS